MRKLLLSGIVGLWISSSAFAWNDRGHMLVGELAWFELTPPARVQVFDILKGHPHYQEYLSAERPQNIGEDEWAFLRAATWPDWVKSNYSDEYDRREWHYINIPFVPHGSEITPPDDVPPAVNVVRQISWCASQARSSPSAKWKAVNTCWVFHLLGDIHQPLHCATLFSDQFPDGDHGGNDSVVRIGRGKKKLHSFWDGVLGNDTDVNSIRGLAQEIRTLEAAHPELTSDDLQQHSSPSEWAREGYQAGVKFAYLNGDLEVANAHDNVPFNEIPLAPASYAQNAGNVARAAVAKAGHRLAKELQKITE